MNTTPLSEIEKACSSAKTLNSNCSDSENVPSEHSLEHKPHKLNKCPSVLNLGDYNTKGSGIKTRATFSDLKVQQDGLKSFRKNSGLKKSTSKIALGVNLSPKKGVKRVQSENFLSSQVKFNLGQMTIREDSEDEKSMNLGFDEIQVDAKRVTSMVDFNDFESGISPNTKQLEIPQDGSVLKVDQIQIEK
jgi:hypothetical protein